MSSRKTSLAGKIRRLILALSLFMFADLVLTISWIGHGGEEANPMMAQALDGGFVTFAFVKLALSAFGLAALAACIERPLAKAGLVLCTLVYGLLFGYHLALHASL